MKKSLQKRLKILKISTLRPDLRLGLVALIFLSLCLFSNTKAYPYVSSEDYLVLDDPRQAVTADFNNDGFQDMAVINYRPNKVSILLNDQHGAFYDPVLYDTNYSTVGVGPSSITTIDIDNNGVVDLAISNYASNTINILINNGSGVFSAGLSYDLGFSGNISSISAGSPVIITTAGAHGFTTGDLVTITDTDSDPEIIGNFYVNVTGATSFEVEGSVTTPGTTGRFQKTTSPSYIVAAKINADAFFDLVVANNYNGTLALHEDSISVFINNGSGGFLSPVSYPVSNGPRQIVSADFNGDLHNDLAVTSLEVGFGQNLEILLNNGTGVFLSKTSVSSSVGYIVAGDFDNDLDIDLAGFYTFGDLLVGSLSIFRNNGSGTFTVQPPSYVLDILSSSIIAGNFDDSSGLDLAVSNYASDAIMIFHGNNNLTFSLDSTLNTLPGPVNLTSADFDKDNKLDIVSVNKSEKIYVSSLIDTYSGNKVSVYRSGVIIEPSNGNTSAREGGVSDVYSIVLASAPADDVNITFNYDDSATGIELTDASSVVIPNGGFITFTPLNWSISQDITITAKDDADPEGQLIETITHTISSAGDADYDGSVAPNIDVSVSDNDQAGVTIDVFGGVTPGYLQLREGTINDDSLSIMLEFQPTADVAVTINHSSQIDISPSILYFTNANWSIPQTVNLSAIHDLRIEGTRQEDISFSVSSPAPGGDPAYNGFVVPVISVNIIDLDILFNNPVCLGRMLDLNNDGNIDTIDQQFMLDMMKGHAEFNICADISQDGYIGPDDYGQSEQYLRYHQNLLRYFQIIVSETGATTEVAEGGGQ